MNLKPVYLKLLALLVFTSGAWAQNQSGTMVVVLKDGTRHSFRLGDVARIEMADGGSAVTPAPVVTGASTSFAGLWSVRTNFDSNYSDTFTIQTQGNTLTGTWTNPAGRFAGQLSRSGNLDGYWFQTQSGQRCGVAREGTFYWGRISLKLDATDRFSGTWDYCGEATPANPKTWAGTRIR